MKERAESIKGRGKSVVGQKNKKKIVIALKIRTYGVVT
jgi:hypothetical protein